MAILLDQTTKAEYDALSLASARASAVVAALSGTVVVEVYSGTDTLMASGTMAAPWATSSGATITVGEITGVGLLVTTGGAPDANWYCQFRSGSRFARGSFGVQGSGRDFVWSLASFQTGSRGTLGTVVLTTTGTAEGGPVLLTAPTISTFFAATANSNEVLAANVGTYQYDDGVRLTGTVGAGDLISRPAVDKAVFYIGSNSSVSPVTDEYKNWYLFCDGCFPYESAIGQPPAFSGVYSYDGATKRITVNWTGNSTPTVGGTWRLVKDYPVVRKYQWKRNGTGITGQKSRVYSVTSADVGQSITVEETVGFVDWTFHNNAESPTPSASIPLPTASTTAASTAYTPSASVSSATKITGFDDFSYIGSFRITSGTLDSRIGLMPAAQSQNGSVSLLLLDAGGSCKEFEIPGLSTSSDPTLLPPATIKRSSSDVLNGWGTLAKTGYGFGAHNNCGVVTSGSSSAIIGVCDYYGPRDQNFFIKRPANITTATSANPFCVYPTNQAANYGRWASGTTCEIPTALQSTLGGDLLSCSGFIANAGSNSQAPAGMVYNSADIDAAVAKYETGTALSGSTTTAILAGTASSTANYYLNWQVVFNIGGSTVNNNAYVTAYNHVTKQITFTAIANAVTATSTYSLIAPVYSKQLYGKTVPYEPDSKTFPTLWNTANGSFNFAAFIPRGTTSVVNVTSSIQGLADYGLWATNNDNYGNNWGGISVTGRRRLFLNFSQDSPSPGPQIASIWTDPVNNFCLFWVYDTADLAAVVAGSKTYDQINPSAVFPVSLPYAGNGKLSAVFDNVNNRLYIYNYLQTFSGLLPMVHVYSCNKYA